MQVCQRRVVGEVDMGRAGERKEVVHQSRCGHNGGGPLLFRIVPSSEEQMVA